MTSPPPTKCGPQITRDLGVDRGLGCSTILRSSLPQSTAARFGLSSTVYSPAQPSPCQACPFRQCRRARLPMQHSEWRAAHPLRTRRRSLSALASTTPRSMTQSGKVRRQSGSSPSSEATCRPTASSSVARRVERRARAARGATRSPASRPCTSSTRRSRMLIVKSAAFTREPFLVRPNLLGGARRVTDCACRQLLGRSWSSRRLQQIQTRSLGWKRTPPTRKIGRQGRSGG